MAYTQTTNIDARKIDDNGYPQVQRTIHESNLTHLYFVSHHFTTEVSTTAIRLSTLISGNAGTNLVKQPFKSRHRLIITNSDAAAILYVSLFSNVSSTKFQYAIQPGGTLDKPWSGNIDPYLIGSAAVITQITEEC